MLDPSKRFLTFVLALGIVVLVVAIALGERAGDRVMGQVTEKRLTDIAPVTVTPAPQGTVSPYGPDWKRTDVMAAATDPGFPDPRVPPAALPTAAPAPKATPTPRKKEVKATPGPDLNIPIWRRNAPLPTASPQGSESPGPSPTPSATAEPTTQP